MRRNGWFDIAARSRLLACIACLSALASERALAQSSTIEHAVKATYIYKFAPFVEWPAGAFVSPSDPLVLCIAGVDAVSQVVDEAVQGQMIGGHPISVLHLLTPDNDSRCHILYVASQGASAVAALDKVRGRPILTVTDTAREAQAHGIINFVVQDNRVRFEIDQNAAAENHLVISSKLLNLALRVRPKP